MRIMIYGINYAPELTGIGKYTGEMASWLAGQGHEVHVITGKPYYPEWKIDKKYTRKWWTSEWMNGVRVIRCPLYVPKKVNAWKRIIHECSFLICVFPVWLKTLFQKKFELIISISPPFHLGLMPLLYSKIKGTNLLTHVQDLQVDAARSLSLIKSKWILNLMFAAEKYILKNSLAVSTISPGMMARIMSKGIPGEKIILFPNFVDTDFIRPLTKMGSLRNEFGIGQHEKVILYSGNLGEKQGLEIIIEAAKHFVSRKDIHFILVGSGVFKADLEEMVRANQLTNIKFFPLAPYQKLPVLLATADIHLVLQRKSASDLVMPSKLSSILAAGGCALVTAVPGTYLYDFVAQNQLGVLVEPECPRSLVTALEKALAEDLSVYCMQAREYAVKNLSLQSVMSKFENQLFKLQKIKARSAEMISDLST